jgi:hypothetical protein
MICPNDEGVIKECWEDGVPIGERRCASPDHFVYATTGKPPKGAYVFRTSNNGRTTSSYCLACGDEDCRAEHARNVEHNRQERIKAGLELAEPAVLLAAGPRSRLSGLAGA